MAAPAGHPKSNLQPVCSITLGVEAVNTLEMTNAYATLAAHGVRRYANPSSCSSRTTTAR